MLVRIEITIHLDVESERSVITQEMIDDCLVKAMMWQIEGEADRLRPYFFPYRLIRFIREITVEVSQAMHPKLKAHKHTHFLRYLSYAPPGPHQIPIFHSIAFLSDLTIQKGRAPEKTLQRTVARTSHVTNRPHRCGIRVWALHLQLRVFSTLSHNSVLLYSGRPPRSAR